MMGRGPPGHRNLVKSHMPSKFCLGLLSTVLNVCSKEKAKSRKPKTQAYDVSGISS